MDDTLSPATENLPMEPEAVISSDSKPPEPMIDGSASAHQKSSIPTVSVSKGKIPTPVPAIAGNHTTASDHETPSKSSTAASDITSDGDNSQNERTTGRSLTTRPKLGSRKSSGTMIVDRNHPEVEIKEETYPPNDARAMSPKRSSAETERMVGASRQAIQNRAAEIQLGLSALAEKVENICADHEKLEKDNLALQEYIGGLTRSMSKTKISNKK